MNINVNTDIIIYIINLIYIIIKTLILLVTNSVTLFLEMFYNNILPIISKVIIYISNKQSVLPPDIEHPYGYGRMQYIINLLFSVAIILFSTCFFVFSIKQLFAPQQIILLYIEKILDNNYIIETILSYIYTHIYMIIIILFFSNISYLLYITIYNFNIYNDLLSLYISINDIYKKYKDIIISYILNLLSLFSIISIYIYNNYIIDIILGILLSIYILYYGYKLLYKSIVSLLGEMPNDGLVQKIKDISLTIPGILGVHDIIIHNYGHINTFVSLHIEVDYHITLSDAHIMADTLEIKLERELNIIVITHVDPVITDNMEINKIYLLILKSVNLVNSNLQVHDLQYNNNVITFDIIIPLEMNNKEKLFSVTSQILSLLYNNSKKVNIDINKYSFQIKYDYLYSTYTYPVDITDITNISNIIDKGVLK